MSLLSRTFELRCPLCGNEEEFIVSVSIMANVHNDTNDMQSYTDADGDQEWDENSYARCNAEDCVWTGITAQLEEAYRNARKAD